MPSLLTHYFFAEDFLFLHQGEKNFLNEYKSAFRLGCQGPDPLFFLGVLPKRVLNPSLIKKRLGSQLHRQPFDKLMEEMVKELTMINLDTEKHIFMAFIMGQLAHYVLDSTCHPFVYYWSGFDKKGKLTGKYHYAHSHFESRIDTCLAKNRDREDLVKMPSEVLRLNQDVLSSISVDFASVLTTYFNIKLKTDCYEKSVKNMDDLYTYIHSGSSLRVAMWGKSFIGQLHLPSDTDKNCLNNDHEEWKDTYSGNIRKESFTELYALALKKLDKMYLALLTDGFSLDSIKPYLSEVNYSGLHKGEIHRFCDRKSTHLD